MTRASKIIKQDLDTQLKLTPKGSRHRFYRASTDGTTLSINYGYQGKPGREISKEFETDLEAKAELLKKIIQRLKSGYRCTKLNNKTKVDPETPKDLLDEVRLEIRKEKRNSPQKTPTKRSTTPTRKTVKRSPKTPATPSKVVTFASVEVQTNLTKRPFDSITESELDETRSEEQARFEKRRRVRRRLNFANDGEATQDPTSPSNVDENPTSIIPSQQHTQINTSQCVGVGTQDILMHDSGLDFGGVPNYDSDSDHDFFDNDFPALPSSPQLLNNTHDVVVSEQQRNPDQMLIDEIAQHKQTIQALQDERHTEKHRLEGLIAELEVCKQMISDKDSAKVILEEALQANQTLLRNAEQERVNTFTEYSNLKQRLEALEKEYNEIVLDRTNKEGQIMDLWAAKTKMNEQYEALIKREQELTATINEYKVHEAIATGLRNQLETVSIETEQIKLSLSAKVEEIQSLQAEIKQLQQEKEDIQAFNVAAANAKEEEITRIKEDLNNKGIELTKMSTEIELRSKYIESESTRLSQLQEQLQQERVLIDKQSTELAEMRSSMEGQQQAINEREAQLANKELELTLKERYIMEQHNEITNKQAQLAAKEIKMREQEDRLSKTEMELFSLGMDLAEKENQLADRAAELERDKQFLVMERKALAVERSALEELGSKLNSESTRLQELQCTISQREKQLDIQSIRIREMASDLDSRSEKARNAFRLAKTKLLEQHESRKKRIAAAVNSILFEDDPEHTDNSGKDFDDLMDVFDEKEIQK